jgi:DNA polymerase-1
VPKEFAPYPHRKFKLIGPDDIGPCLEALGREHDAVAADTETTGLDFLRDRIRLLQLCVSDRTEPVMIFDWQVLDREFLQPILDWLSAPEGPYVVFHNSNFDVPMLWTEGCIIHRRRIRCSQLAERVLTMGRLDARYKGAGNRLGSELTKTEVKALSDDEEQQDPAFVKWPVSLAASVKRRLSWEMPKELQRSDWSLRHLSQQQLQYSADDAGATMDLYRCQMIALRKERLLPVAELEWEVSWAFCWQMLNGMAVDAAAWSGLHEEFTAEEASAKDALLDSLDRQLRAQGHRGLQRDLFGELDRSLKPNSSKAFLPLLNAAGLELSSLDKKVVFFEADLTNPVVEPLFAWKDAYARRNYIRGFSRFIDPDTGRVHGRVRQLAPDTGRISSGDPNLTNLPRYASVRAAFTAEEGKVYVVGDFPNIEPRIISVIANDKALQQVFIDGKDPYKAVASIIYGVSIEECSKDLRNRAKPILLGLIYAMGAKTLQKNAQFVYRIQMSLEEALVAREKFFAAYRGVADWHRQLSDELENPLAKIAPRTLLGRRRFLEHTNRKISTCANTPIQGTAADLAKRAICLFVDKVMERGLIETELVGFVHDELILVSVDHEAEAAAQILKESMEEGAAEFLDGVPCPVDVGIGRSWKDAKV